MDEHQILINGQPCAPEAAVVSVFDRGFQYGDGVFETLAAVGGRVREREAHLERLALGARLLAIPEPDRQVLDGELDRLARELGKGDRAVLKVLYTRGAGGRGLEPPESPLPTRVLMRLPWPDHPPEWVQRGVRIFTCRTRQMSGAALDGRIKSMNQLNHIAARLEWQDPEIAEGLLCDLSGRVIEGTVSNLFAIQSGVLLTPDLAGAGLPGVTRRRILELADELGIPAHETDLYREDLQEMEELFLTNSVIGVWPIREHEGRNLPQAPGPITTRLREALEASYG